MRAHGGSCDGFLQAQVQVQRPGGGGGEHLNQLNTIETLSTSLLTMHLPLGLLPATYLQGAPAGVCGGDAL